MKYSIILIFVLSALLTVSCGNGSTSQSGSTDKPSAEGGTPVLTFNEYTYDFGKIAQGEKVTHTFIFTNSGTGTLVVSSVTASCGCTAPKYDTKPIIPGEKGNVEVLFNASGMNGKQTKTITVKSNASVPVVLLTITAEVTEE